jgi:hypothetical protein
MASVVDMANYCSNALTLVGPPQDIAAFLTKAATAETNNRSLLAEFDPTVNPEASKSTRDSLWGTKTDYPDTIDINTDRNTIRFATAWSPPVWWLHTISENWPTLTFALAWIEEGNEILGLDLVHNGEPLGAHPAFDDYEAPDIDHDFYITPDSDDWDDHLPSITESHATAATLRTLAEKYLSPADQWNWPLVDALALTHPDEYRSLLDSNRIAFASTTDWHYDVRESRPEIDDWRVTVGLSNPS